MASQLVRRLDNNHDILFGGGLADYLFDFDAVGQAVKTRLLFLKGEWFLDTEYGTPYLQKINVKPAELAVAEFELKKIISDTRGVREIQTFNLSLDSTRKLTVTTTITTVYNTTNNLEVSV